MPNKKTYVDDSGYLRFTDSKKLVHRWVASKKYGSNEINGKEIHHLDGDKLNNEENNLILLTKKDHWLLQEYIKKIDFRGKYSIPLWVVILLGLNLAIQIIFIAVPWVPKAPAILLLIITLLMVRRLK